MLPRIISAAAPPDENAQENRRQCKKVLRLWLERKILPEFVLKKQLERILVEDYGSNAVRKSGEEGDGRYFVQANLSDGRRRLVSLEDVEGELEMEDAERPNDTSSIPSPEKSPPPPFPAGTPPENPPPPSSPWPFFPPPPPPPPFLYQHPAVPYEVGGTSNAPLRPHYGPSHSYGDIQALRQWQPNFPGGPPFSQMPFFLEPSPSGPSHQSYPMHDMARQLQNLSYSSQFFFPNDPLRHHINDQWQAQGHFGAPQDRPAMHPRPQRGGDWRRA